jgi:hypothetical protein
MADPAARAIAQAFAAFDPSRQQLEEYRCDLARAFAASAPKANVPHEERMIPGASDSQEVQVLLYRPEQALGKRCADTAFRSGNGLADEALDDTLYHTQALRDFVGINLSHSSSEHIKPDQRTQNPRHM